MFFFPGLVLESSGLNYYSSKFSVTKSKSATELKPENNKKKQKELLKTKEEALRKAREKVVAEKDKKKKEIIDKWINPSNITSNIGNEPDDDLNNFRIEDIDNVDWSVLGLSKTFTEEEKSEVRIAIKDHWCSEFDVDYDYVWYNGDMILEYVYKHYPKLLKAVAGKSKSESIDWNYASSSSYRWWKGFCDR